MRVGAVQTGSRRVGCNKAAPGRLRTAEVISLPRSNLEVCGGERMGNSAPLCLPAVANSDPRWLLRPPPSHLHPGRREGERERKNRSVPFQAQSGRGRHSLLMCHWLELRPHLSYKGRWKSSVWWVSVAEPRSGLKDFPRLPAGLRADCPQPSLEMAFVWRELPGPRPHALPGSSLHAVTGCWTSKACPLGPRRTAAKGYPVLRGP